MSIVDFTKLQIGRLYVEENVGICSALFFPVSGLADGVVGFMASYIAMHETRAGASYAHDDFDPIWVAPVPNTERTVITCREASESDIRMFLEGWEPYLEDSPTLEDFQRQVAKLQGLHIEERSRISRLCAAVLNSA